jgi:hypothetical protein
MLSAMLKNGWTTTIGILLGALTYLSQSGVAMPSTKKDWANLMLAALMAGLGIAAKDATTGSKPAA